MTPQIKEHKLWNEFLAHMDKEDKKQDRICSKCEYHKKNNGICGLVSGLCINSANKPYFKEANLVKEEDIA